MDKGVKQRLLGGVVLIAGAALFLPLLFDGSGAGLPPRPEIPARPAVPSADDLAPKLDKQAAAANAAVDAAHADPTFYPVAAPGANSAGASAEAPVSSAGDEQFKMTTPAQPAQPVAQNQQPAAQQQAAQQQSAQQAQADASAAQARKEAAAEAARAQAEKERHAREAKAEAEREHAVIEKKLATEKVAAEKDERQDPAITDAWIVQVASLGTETKAQELVGKLHKKGYRASTHQVGGFWKVSVGPELNKEKAAAIKDKLMADSSLHLTGGWVQAYRP